MYYASLLHHTLCTWSQVYTTTWPKKKMKFIYTTEESRVDSVEYYLSFSFSLKQGAKTRAPTTVNVKVREDNVCALRSSQAPTSRSLLSQNLSQLPREKRPRSKPNPGSTLVSYLWQNPTQPCLFFCHLWSDLSSQPWFGLYFSTLTT